MKATTRLMKVRETIDAVPNVGTQTDCTIRTNVHIAEIVHGEPSSVRNESLIAAASGGNLDYVHSLLDRGADPSTGKYRALRGARENGHVEVVKRLLQANLEPAARRIALDIAISKGQDEMVDLLKRSLTKNFQQL